MASQFNSLSRSRPPSEMTLKVEALLRRYPDLSEQELATLIGTFPYLPVLDVGLMTADDHLSERLEAFHRDHGHLLKAPMASLVGVLVLPAIVAAALFWWLMNTL